MMSRLQLGSRVQVGQRTAGLSLGLPAALVGSAEPSAAVWQMRPMLAPPCTSPIRQLTGATRCLLYCVKINRPKTDVFSITYFLLPFLPPQQQNHRLVFVSSNPPQHLSVCLSQKERKRRGGDQHSRHHKSPSSLMLNPLLARETIRHKPSSKAFIELGTAYFPGASFLSPPIFSVPVPSLLPTKKHCQPRLHY